MKAFNNTVIITVLFMSIWVSGCKFRNNNCDGGQVVACINNYQLTVDDFKDEATIIKCNMSLSRDPATLKQELLQGMINKKIMLQEAQKLNFDKQKSFMKEIERYWEQALLKLLLKKKSDEFYRTTQVSKPEIQARYLRMQKKFFVQMLVLNDKSAAEKFSQPGENFEDLKNSYKNNIISAQDSTWRTTGDLPLNIENALYSLKPGQTSMPVQYSGNWVVIRVLKEEPVALEPLEKIINQISSDLLEAKKTQAVDSWMEELRSKADVKIDNKVLDGIDLNRRAYER